MVREARKLRETIAPVSAPADRAPPASSADQTSGDLAAFLDEPAFARPPDGYEVTRALLSATRDECRRIGARFLVLLIPPRELVTEAPNPTSEMAVYSARSYRAIRDVCRLEKLPYLDTLGELAFRHRDGEALFFARDPHMTPQGHVALAEMVARKISEDKLMPDPVGPKELRPLHCPHGEHMPEHARAAPPASRSRVAFSGLEPRARPERWREGGGGDGGDAELTGDGCSLIATPDEPDRLSY